MPNQPHPSHEPRSGQNTATAKVEEFPSTSMLIAIYCLGSFVSLVLAFNPDFTPTQTINCLLMSWALTSIALGVSVMSDRRPVAADDEEQDLFY